MSREQEFYDRVELEYNSFVNDIETMDVENPIQAICEKYHPLGEELHETIETIMDSIIEEQSQEQGGMDLC